MDVQSNERVNEGRRVGSKLVNRVDRESVKTDVISAGVNVCIKIRLPSTSITLHV